MTTDTRESIIKSLLPTYEEIDIDSFELTVDNHLDRYGSPTRIRTIDMKFRIKNGQFVEIHIE